MDSIGIQSDWKLMVAFLEPRERFRAKPRILITARRRRIENNVPGAQVTRKTGESKVDRSCVGGKVPYEQVEHPQVIVGSGERVHL